jgi:hypothetical protein
VRIIVADSYSKIVPRWKEDCCRDEGCSRDSGRAGAGIASKSTGSILEYDWSLSAQLWREEQG